MSWTVTERPRVLDDETITRLGNKLLVGNGYIGYRGTLEEHDARDKVAVIVSGLYDKVGDLWREPVNLPNGGLVRLAYAGEPLRAGSGPATEHSQTLDMGRGLHARETRFVAADGNEIVVRSRRFASLTSHHLLGIEYTVEAARACTIEVQTGVDGEVWDLNGPHLERLEPAVAGETVALAAHTHENDVPIAVAEVVLGAPEGQTRRCERARAIREFELVLEPGVPRTFRKLVAHHTGLDDPDPLAAAIASCSEAAAAGFEALLAAHEAAWEERWRRCDVRIEGDPEAQLALRFSLYHLLAVAPAHADDVSIPARGLSGQVYKGAIFWDTEIFMLPFFAHAFPELARNLLTYRYRTLDGARRKAREYGFRGAYFAWESQDDGDDACTLFGVTDVFTNRPMRTYFRDKQYHISADVAYAIWNAYRITGDESFLLDGGAEVIFECARFFTSCTHYNPLRGRYEILDVIGPDEYHERVNNNAYTNWMAAHTFRICLDLAGLLEERHPELAHELVERLGFRRDLETIREMAAGLYLPAPDPETLLVPQFDGYFGLADVPLDEVLERKLHPHEYLGGGNGLATTTQVIKQADVILGLYLFEDDHDAAVKKANWEYYEPRTEHGSTLSACSYALVAAGTGRVDWAYDYFMRTASIDLWGEPKQFVGTLYIGGTHPAANGGAWMAAVLGLCGIRCSGDTISVEPRLPAWWQSVSVPLACGGRPVVVTVRHDSVSVSTDADPGRPIRVLVAGETRTLSERGEVAIALVGGAAAR